MSVNQGNVNPQLSTGKVLIIPLLIQDFLSAKYGNFQLNLQGVMVDVPVSTKYVNFQLNPQV